MKVKIELEVTSDSDNSYISSPLALSTDGDDIVLELQDPERTVHVARRELVAALELVATIKNQDLEP